MKDMMVMKSLFNYELFIGPEQLDIVKPDRKYPSTCHIRTNGGRWFHVKHTLKELTEIYVKAKAVNTLIKGE